MKIYTTLFLTLILFFLCKTVSAQENPFMQMAGEKYSEYSQELYNIHNNFPTLDTLTARKVIGQVEEVVQKTGGIEWVLLNDYFETILLWNKWSLYGDDRYSTEELLKIALELLKKTIRANTPQLELMVRQKIIDYYWIFFNNYEAAFELYTIQNERLLNISSDDIPEKVNYYINIADAYISFKDYPKAISYYNKVLEDKVNIRNQYSKQHARNGIGLSSCNGYNDLDRSDSCFRSMMNVVFHPENKIISEVWDGIAEGNIGYNMLLRGEYDNAIPLLKSSIEKVLKGNDYAFASGPAIDLADIYLRKGKLPEAKYYIDLAKKYYDIMQREGRLPRIYEVQSNYYAAAGNSRLSMAYLDSTLQANKQYEKQFNTTLLLRMEQKESAQQQQELANEKKMRRNIQIRLLIITGGFTIISILLVLLYFLYRKQKDAYRELVRKSQEWAQVQLEKEHRTQNNTPDEIDLSLMKEIERLMNEEKIYKDNTLSVDSLSHLLGAKKHNVSGVINRCTQNNFNTFVNEYRVKEAIRLMSDKNIQIYSIDGIAFDLGFGDRKSLHRVFKKMTGLSPTEFKKNVNLCY